MPPTCSAWQSYIVEQQCFRKVVDSVVHDWLSHFGPGRGHGRRENTSRRSVRSRDIDVVPQKFTPFIMAGDADNSRQLVDVRGFVLGRTAGFRERTRERSTSRPTAG